MTDGGLIASVRRRIDEAAERGSRDPEGVRLIAVTKTVAPGRVRAVLEAGVRDLGENRVQEALAKQLEVPGEARWHLIGHLQTNKARRAAGAFASIQTVDSERCAAALGRARPDPAAPLSVLIEVELTGLPGRTGVSPEALGRVAVAVAAQPSLRLDGLMTVAAPVPAPEQARPLFARLRRLRDGLEQALQARLPELSMGMSDDFEIAIEEGATMVRIGRAIFGERPPPA